MADNGRIALRLKFAGVATVRAARLRRFGLHADETAAKKELAATVAAAERRRPSLT